MMLQYTQISELTMKPFFLCFVFVCFKGKTIDGQSGNSFHSSSYNTYTSSSADLKLLPLSISSFLLDEKSMWGKKWNFHCGTL